ncbi:MAG: hypothetical protein N2035_03455 [Chthoniobacterales bacterium]|nr:hypothetical protein [Chthoniobacterales bacterium]
MNTKQAAAFLVAFAALALLYALSLFRTQVTLREKELQQAQSESVAAATALTQEKIQLEKLKATTESYLRYLEAWEPHFSSLNNAQSAELSISLRLKSANLLTLAQRYERINAKFGEAIPAIMRASLSIEDNYVSVLNWIGLIEEELPTLRTASISITKGERPNDIRTELVFEVPLIQ